jgi:hypothetical protein
VVSIEHRFSRPDAITAAPASTLQCANVSVCKRRCGRVDHWRRAGGQQTVKSSCACVVVVVLNRRNDTGNTHLFSARAGNW